MSRKNNRVIDRILRGLFFLSLLFLAFMLGIVASIHQTVFYKKTKELGEYSEAFLQGAKFKWEMFNSALWTKSPGHETGVTRSDPQRYDAGLTLFTSNSTQAYLVDMAGRIVNKWSLPEEEFDRIEGEHNKNTLYWGDAHAFPNGDLLVIYESLGMVYGEGLIKLDKDSHLLWVYRDHAHHALDVGPGGTIYVLTAFINHHDPYGLKATQPPFLDEQVTILAPNGKRIKKISLINAFKHSPYADLLNRSGDRNITHANWVKYIDATVAAQFPFAKEGDLLISLRNMDTIAILDPRREVITWAVTGFWRRQHNPSFLDNGHMMVFDNECGDCPRHNRSRAVEFNPLSGKKLWEFGAEKNENLHSVTRGLAQRLPNGDTFIVESQMGRLLEVTPQKNIVWEYYNPIRTGPDKDYIGYINFAERFPEGYFTFLPPRP